MDAESIRKILVIDLAFIGDVILATPTMRALKTRFPKASLTMLTVPLTARFPSGAEALSSATEYAPDSR